MKKDTAGKGITLRAALPSDAEALLSIYAPYVRDTAVSFEYEVPRSMSSGIVSGKYRQGIRI